MPRLALYQPFIEDRNVRRLYRLKIEHRRRTGKKVPMTVLINRILDDFFELDSRRSDPDEHDQGVSGPDP